MQLEKTLTKALLGAAGVLVLTMFHHVYGAIIYSTPWRYHVVDVALPILLVLILAYSVHRWRPGAWIGKASVYFFLSLTLLFPVLTIGVFEGGYNHLVKDILYYAGAAQSTLDQLFPPPNYEMPNDALFEVTGILQFVAGLYTFYQLVSLWRQVRSKKRLSTSILQEAKAKVEEQS